MSKQAALERHESAKGDRWTVIQNYSVNGGPIETAMYVSPLGTNGELLEPNCYIVASRFDWSIEQGRYETLEDAQRQADELNRFDVQGPLDPYYTARRERLKKLTPHWEYLTYSGPSEARWPVRPDRYLIRGTDFGWHGADWQALAEDLEAVRGWLSGDLGHEITHVVDLDTGDEVPFERLVSVSLKRTITAEEFERQYAERGGVAVEWLRKHRVVRPCDCGDEICEGWQSVSHEAAAEIDDPEKPWAR